MSDFKAQMNPIKFRPGLCLRSRWESWQRSPDLLSRLLWREGELNGKRAKYSIGPPSIWSPLFLGFKGRNGAGRADGATGKGKGRRRRCMKIAHPIYCIYFRLQRFSFTRSYNFFEFFFAFDSVEYNFCRWQFCCWVYWQFCCYYDAGFTYLFSSFVTAPMRVKTVHANRCPSASHSDVHCRFNADHPGAPKRFQCFQKLSKAKRTDFAISATRDNNSRLCEVILMAKNHCLESVLVVLLQVNKLVSELCVFVHYLQVLIIGDKKIQPFLTNLRYYELIILPEWSR